MICEAKFKLKKSSIILRNGKENIQNFLKENIGNL